MKKLCFISALVLMSLLNTNVLLGQASRLTKVGYLNIDEVVTNILEDQELIAKVEERFRAEAQETGKFRSGRREIQKEVQKQMGIAILNIVRREGYTLILERTEMNILYADRNFDITQQVIAFVREAIVKR